MAAHFKHSSLFLQTCSTAECSTHEIHSPSPLKTGVCDVLRKLHSYRCNIEFMNEAPVITGTGEVAAIASGVALRGGCCCT
jgi:hypothetical protein